MDPDLIFTLGLLIGVLSIPSVFGALADLRVPPGAIAALLLAAGLIAYANHLHPQGYRMIDIPDVVVAVIGRYVL